MIHKALFALLSISAWLFCARDVSMHRMGVAAIDAAFGVAFLVFSVRATK